MSEDRTVEEIIKELSQEILENILLHQEGNVPFDKFLQQLDTYYRKKFAKEVMDKIENLKYFATRVPGFPYTLVVELDDIKKVLGVDNGQ